MQTSATAPEIAISCSTVVSKKDSARPCIVYVDITFLDSKTQLDAILFQNYYVSSVSLFQPIKNGQEVCILESKQLMKKYYSESGAQIFHSISVSEFNENYAEGGSIRIYLFQPSSQWNSFEIRNIRAVGKLPSTLLYSQSDLYQNNSTKQSLTNLISQDLKVLYKKSQSKLQNRANLNLLLGSIDGETSRKSMRAERKKKRTENPDASAF